MNPPGIVYLTFNDQPSGVYFGQVSDVCHFLEKELGQKTRLIAFASMRGYFETRSQIRKSWRRTTVLPMLPGIQRWSKNFWLLLFFALFLRRRTWIARNPFACSLALRLKKWKMARKVVYDGRGAVHAEWTEYKISTDETLLNQLAEMEKNCVLQSDRQLAVSHALVRYWKDKFNSPAEKATVIPCTLSGAFLNPLPNGLAINVARNKAGFGPMDVVVVYSGSTAGWQSGSTMQAFFTELLKKNPSVKLLMLSKFHDEARALDALFPGRVLVAWLPTNEVWGLLTACDYGVLVREPSITNLVASPTKYAEYLSAGLPVLISDNIGDFTQFTAEHNCGTTISAEIPTLRPVSVGEKNRLHQLAHSHFTKNAFREQYRELTEEVKK